MTIRIARPLPECELCERPARRKVLKANAGLCNSCARGIADTVRMLPVPGPVADLADYRRRLAERAQDDDTAYVERYVPPVPGQLELPAGDPLDGDEGSW